MYYKWVLTIFLLNSNFMTSLWETPLAAIIDDVFAILQQWPSRAWHSPSFRRIFIAGSARNHMWMPCDVITKELVPRGGIHWFSLITITVWITSEWRRYCSLSKSDVKKLVRHCKRERSASFLRSPVGAPNQSWLPIRPNLLYVYPQFDERRMWNASKYLWPNADGLWLQILPLILKS